MDAQPDMVRGPHTTTVAQRRPQQLRRLGHRLGPLRLGKLVEEGAAEGPEPALDAMLERRGAWHMRYLAHDEAGFGKQLPIFLRGGKEPRREQRRIAVAAHADGAHGGGKGGDIASAFGGGSSQAVFGARSGATLLTRATSVLAALFIIGALALTVWGSRGPGSVVGGIDGPAPEPAPTAPVPAAPANPTVTPSGNTTP